MASTLEEEVLLWALDGDSVNNFVLFAQREHGADGEHALALIRTLSRSGLVHAFIHAYATGAERDLKPQDLSSALLAEEPYVLLTKTDRTLPRLNELRAATPAT